MKLTDNKMVMNYGPDMQEVLYLARKYTCTIEEEIFSFNSIEDAQKGIIMLIRVLEEWDSPYNYDITITFNQVNVKVKR